MQEVIKESLKTQYSNAKTKITDEAVDAVNEILKVLVVECTTRACKVANDDNTTKVTLDHVQNVLASVVCLPISFSFLYAMFILFQMLDFS